jgi:hypothetical protein
MTLLTQSSHDTAGVSTELLACNCGCGRGHGLCHLSEVLPNYYPPRRGAPELLPTSARCPRIITHLGEVLPNYYPPRRGAPELLPTSARCSRIITHLGEVLPSSSSSSHHHHYHYHQQSALYPPEYVNIWHAQAECATWTAEPAAMYQLLVLFSLHRLRTRDHRSLIRQATAC